MWPCNLTPGHISRGQHDPKGYMHPSIHCSTVYNSQDMEAPKYPLIEKSRKKMWYIYTMEGYLAIKNNWNNVICSNLDGPRVSYWVKSDREGEIYDVSYMWDLKKKWYRKKIYWAPSFVYWFSCLISSKQRWAHFSIFSS